jgi:hypothetical protein
MQLPAERRRRVLARRAGSVAALAVVVAVALRLWYLTTPQATIDGDEAMTGLMARHILDGKLYVYLAGQTYNGAVEQYLQAALFAVLPDGPFVLRLPQVAIAAAVTAMVYVVGIRVLPTRWHAALAALLFAVGPFFNIWKGVRSHGAYGTAQLVGLLGLWCALQLSPARGGGEAGGGFRRRWAAGVGLACGLGAWLSPSAAYLLLPAVLWTAGCARRMVRLSARGAVAGVLAGVLGAAVGAAPALAWVAANGELPGFGGPQPASSPADRLANLAGPVLRSFAGVAAFGDAPVWPRPLGAGAVLALGAAYAVALWRRRRGVADLLRLRGQRPADLLLVVAPVVAALYMMSANTWYVREPRYLFVAYPALALGLAALVPRAGRAAVAVATALLLVVAGTATATLRQQHREGPHDLLGCLGAAADWLVATGHPVVYADYWTGMPLQFAAGDRLTVGVEGGGRWKFPESRWAADAAPTVTYVAAHIHDPMGQEEDPVIVHDRQLAGNGVQARRADLGCLVVWTDLRPQRRPWEVGLGGTMPPGWRPYWGS